MGRLAGNSPAMQYLAQKYFIIKYPIDWCETYQSWMALDEKKGPGTMHQTSWFALNFRSIHWIYLNFEENFVSSLKSL